MKRRVAAMLDRRKRRMIRNVWTRIASLPGRRNLARLAAIHRTDKLSHGYMPIYQRHFHSLRHKKITLIEIGIGGYGDPWAGGNSLRLWASYFYRGHVIGIDIEDKRPHASRRITVLQGDQSDPEFLARLIAVAPEPDIVIDDGSHFCKDVIASFNALFPHMKPGGIYVIEDTQTSYWPACGGSMDRRADHTTMNYFKALADGLNHAEYPLDDYEADELERTIVSIHFYHNLIFIEKGDNTLKSNVALKDRQAGMAES